MEVLRAEPDTDTVRALEQLAALEVFAGSPDADRLSTEALTLGQALGAGADQLGGLLRDPRDLPRQRIAAHRGDRLLPRGRAAGHAGGRQRNLGRALLNLSDPLAVTDPAAAAEAARTAAGHLRRTGAREYLAVAIANLTQALLILGDWDAAEAELTQATDADGLADNEFLACYRGWLAALRGDAAAAERMLAALPDLRASEEPAGQSKDQHRRGVHRGFPPPAAGRDAAGPRNARSRRRPRDRAKICAGRGRWPPAPPTTSLMPPPPVSCLPCSTTCQPGYLAPMQRAERDLARARLAASQRRPGRHCLLAAAIGALRERSTPYHLAHGLLDHAQYLTRRTRPEPPRQLSTKPATSPATCAASHCWIVPHTSRPQDPPYRLRAALPAQSNPQPRPRSSGLNVPICYIPACSE